MFDTSTRLGTLVDLVNPVMTASGTAGFSTELAGYFDMSLLGAFVTKSLAHFDTKGNAAPRVVGANSAMLNSVGLTGPGIAMWRATHAPRLEKSNIATIVSIWGRSVGDYGRAIDELDGVGSFVLGLELNVSCPNIEDSNKMFAHSLESLAEIMDATAHCRLPRFVKLSPNTHILMEAIEVVKSRGASGVVLVNTAMGLWLDPTLLVPSLGAKGGGMSGPSLAPIALRAIYDCHANFADLPIIGVGGISTTQGAIAALAAGASAIQIGTASFVDPRVAAKIARELPLEIAKAGFASVGDLVGAAHRGGIASTRIAGVAHLDGDRKRDSDASQ